MAARRPGAVRCCVLDHTKTPAGEVGIAQPLGQIGVCGLDKVVYRALNSLRCFSHIRVIRPRTWVPCGLAKVGGNLQKLLVVVPAERVFGKERRDFTLERANHGTRDRATRRKAIDDLTHRALGVRTDRDIDPGQQALVVVFDDVLSVFNPLIADGSGMIHAGRRDHVVERILVHLFDVCIQLSSVLGLQVGNFFALILAQSELFVALLFGEILGVLNSLRLRRRSVVSVLGLEIGRVLRGFGFCRSRVGAVGRGQIRKRSIVLSADFSKRIVKRALALCLPVTQSRSDDGDLGQNTFSGRTVFATKFTNGERHASLVERSKRRNIASSASCTRYRFASKFARFSEHQAFCAAPKRAAKGVIGVVPCERALPGVDGRGRDACRTSEHRGTDSAGYASGSRPSRIGRLQRFQPVGLLGCHERLGEISRGPRKRTFETARDRVRASFSAQLFELRSFDVVGRDLKIRHNALRPPSANAFCFGPKIVEYSSIGGDAPISLGKFIALFGVCIRV